MFPPESCHDDHDHDHYDDHDNDDNDDDHDDDDYDDDCLCMSICGSVIKPTLGMTSGL